MDQIVTGSNYDNGHEGRKGNWSQTYSGRQFYPLDPRPEEVHIEDIAHHLGMMCRYGGSCLRFYSVAEHSVLLSTIVPVEDRLVGLLHDAAEAYIQDITRPVKRHLSNYAEIEDGIWRAIAKRYGVDPVLPDSVKHADNAMLLAEREQNMTPTPYDWCIPGEPAPVDLQFWDAELAEHRFLQRFRHLTGGWE